jgi:hypothetical protein
MVETRLLQSEQAKVEVVCRGGRPLRIGMTMAAK